jgi:hypothetical protein
MHAFIISEAFGGIAYEKIQFAYSKKKKGYI